MSGPEKLPEEFHEARRLFRERMQRLGVDKETASYCISVARRLEKIYAESQRVAEQEEEALAALRNMLRRLPHVWSAETDEVIYWDCIPGGLEEGDGFVLHIAPPERQPIGVPTPSNTSNGEPPPNAKEMWRQEYQQEVYQTATQVMEHARKQQMLGRVAQEIHEREALVMRIRQRVHEQARSLGWGNELTHSPAFEALIVAAIRTVMCEREADKEGYHRWRERGEEILRELNERHARTQRREAVSIHSWAPQEETGFKRLQEINEKQKRRAKSARR